MNIHSSRKGDFDLESGQRIRRRENAQGPGIFIHRVAKLEGAEINEAKKALADAATTLLHGADAAREAAETARRTFEEADACLGAPLSRLCFEGPEETLRLTENAQPAILTASLAAYRVLEETTGLRPAALGAWPVPRG